MDTGKRSGCKKPLPMSQRAGVQLWLYVPRYLIKKSPADGMMLLNQNPKNVL
jgi:hypothetical protein